MLFHEMVPRQLGYLTDSGLLALSANSSAATSRINLTQPLWCDPCQVTSQHHNNRIQHSTGLAQVREDRKGGH